MEQNPFMNMKMPEIDMETMMSTYKKNIDTIHAASQVAADVMQSLSGLQSKFMHQALDDINRTFKQNSAEAQTKPEDQMKTFTKNVQDALGKTAMHAKEAAEIMTKNTNRVSEMMKDRMKEHMNDLNAFLNPTKTKH